MSAPSSLSDLIARFKSHTAVQQLVKSIVDENQRKIRLKGLAGSSSAILLATCRQFLSQPFFVVLNDKDEASYLYNDLEQILGDENLFFFPSSFKRGIQYGQVLPDALIQRTDTLNAIASVQKPIIVVTYPEALTEKVVSNDQLDSCTMKLAVGERVSLDFISDFLYEVGFERVDFVYEPGQFAVRGGIVDIFSFSSSLPYRIDFFGDEVESIRSFGVDNQLSNDSLSNITIISNTQSESNTKFLTSITGLVPSNTLVWLRDVELMTAKLTEVYSQADAITEGKADDKYVQEAVMSKWINEIATVEFGIKKHFANSVTIEFNTTPQVSFQKNFELLADSIVESVENGYETFILAQNPAQHQRLLRIFESINPNLTYSPVYQAIHEGFVDHTLKICIYTDHQIFDRYHKYKVKHELSHRGTVTLKELVSLQQGDYVVHIDHGVGQFGGLVKTETNGRVQEAIRLIYKDGDSLLVSIHNLHRISKYRGKDSEPPKAHKLGSGVWNRTKQAAKKKVKDIARDLIALYAKRKNERGFAFSPDSYLQEELEASFIYEDTPDQVKATEAIKDDMQVTMPMDRLVCGDVGFGKTELAVRAAFKAVADSKQVAILVPTTILALQHYHTFSGRLKGFPCNVEFISRMKSAKLQKETLTRLAEGKVDIIIGTHALLGEGVKFKDLGLLIVDEEQKFGVAAKEKLKKIKLNVDTLTLTATPIPRTLQFSLMGARDLSILNTPPPNRHPIVTELHQFNHEIIKEAIEFEVNRGGQVFFVHNRVQNISDVQVMISRLCPNVTSIVAHGQMEPTQLEKSMVEFIDGSHDVLVSTTIIESGLDIPNANTIIINNAHMFGLSDLHQMRGRVGRSNRKAFCYLMAPPLESLTPEARRRLKAIEEFSELGSGYSIAMQDLDIRGAGNLLGGEQSGFIAEIGFEAYHRILDEAIQELKEEEFHEVFANESAKKQNDWKPAQGECHVETDMELLIPDSYVNSTPERMRLYRELDSIKTPNELDAFRVRICDRFGAPPFQVDELLGIVKLRWVAASLGIERVTLKNEMLFAYFISNQVSSFYRSELFASIIASIQKSGGAFQMKEVKEKLMLSAKSVKNVQHAIGLLQQIQTASVKV
jgi:transcription-repair coupling factor (superfamily II helicase)